MLKTLEFRSWQKSKRKAVLQFSKAYTTHKHDKYEIAIQSVNKNGLHNELRAASRQTHGVFEKLNTCSILWLVPTCVVVCTVKCSLYHFTEARTKIIYKVCHVTDGTGTH
jgi:hypothetical protein